MRAREGGRGGCFAWAHCPLYRTLAPRESACAARTQQATPGRAHATHHCLTNGYPGCDARASRSHARPRARPSAQSRGHGRSVPLRARMRTRRLETLHTAHSDQCVPRWYVCKAPRRHCARRRGASTLRTRGQARAARAIVPRQVLARATLCNWRHGAGRGAAAAHRRGHGESSRRAGPRKVFSSPPTRRQTLAHTRTQWHTHVVVRCPRHVCAAARGPWFCPPISPTNAIPAGPVTVAGLPNPDRSSDHMRTAAPRLASSCRAMTAQASAHPRVFD